RGCGRSSLTPGRAAGRPGQLRGRIQKNSQPSPAARLVTGSDSYALLTMVALMGAEMSKLSARISMHAPEYSLKLSRPFADRSAACSIVVVGNQIADYLLTSSVRYGGVSAPILSGSGTRSGL